VPFFSKQKHVTVENSKKLTESEPVVNYLKPKTVAMPLKYMKSDISEVHVEVGDSVKIGTKIASDKDAISLFSTISGKVVSIEKRDHISLRKIDHIVIENDFLDEKELFIEPTVALKTLKKENIITCLSGALGIDMPVLTKKMNTIFLNGICESYITSNDAGMLADADLLIEGLLLLMKGADAERGVIVVRQDYTVLFDALTSSAKKFPGKLVEILTVPDILPMRQENALIERALGIRCNGSLSDTGIYIADATSAMEFARCLKTGLPMHERIVTLSGDGFKNPKNVKVRVGTILKDVIAEMGGYSDKLDPKNARLVAGGPLTGSSVITDDLSILSDTKAFLCLMNTERKALPCMRCGTCIDYCPAGLQPSQISMANRDRLLLEKLGAGGCIACGACSSVCPSFVELTGAVAKAKAFIAV